jgi:fimbrial chaperone protein
MIPSPLTKRLFDVCVSHAFICALFVLFLSSANAQQVSVSPLRVTLKTEQQSEILTVRNTSQQAFTIQPKVMKWSQKDGKDVMEATRDVLVAPPIIEVPAGESQVIRLALKRAPEAGKELTYRLFIQQVTAPQKFSTTGLTFAWNLSLPIFVTPVDSGLTPTLQWTGAVNGKTLAFTATNSGSMHIQVKKIRIESSAGVSESSQMFYLLPAQQLKVAIQAPAGVGRSVVLVADTDAGELKQEVVLQ